MGSDPRENREEPITPPVEERTRTRRPVSGSGSVFRGDWDDDDAIPADEEGNLFSKYRVIRKLGGGGMGSVWLVEHVGLKQQRALKVIKADVAESETNRLRFQQEAIILARLSRHPNAVVVYDTGFVGKFAYIDMDFQEGQTLRKRLDETGPMPVLDVHWILGEICAVLGEAHRQKIVHRDIKPQNIMIVPDPDASRGERVKVLDFGIAKIVHDVAAETYASLTQDSMGVLGTIPYSSPEQLGLLDTGPTQVAVDHRSDIYSLGVLLYEMLAGARPFTGTQTKILYDHAHTPPPRFAELAPRVGIPPAVEEVVRRCLEKDPAKRPQTARELFEAFRKAVEECELSMPAGEVAPTGGALPPGGISGTEGVSKGLLGWFSRSIRKVVAGWASVTRPTVGSQPTESEELLPGRGVLATLRRRADVSFPSHVLVGEPYHLSIQLVPIEGDAPGGLPSLRRLPDAGDWPLAFLAFSFSSFAGTGVPPPIEVIVSLVAENFEVSGTGRAELIAPFEGFSNTAQFRLRGVDVGPGRVMIDFAQGGRPIGSVDLTPEVVATIDPKSPPSAPAPPGGALILSLAAGQAPASPDLVIKVFEHRLAGHAGRLQFVLSSTRRSLSDLPVLDGDLGTLDLRAEVVDWVGEQLREVGAVAEQPDVTTEEAERTLGRIGCNLFQQLLPLPLQNLCWTFRERGVREVMVLSDEPHIPWELLKPYRDHPRTGEYEEDEFWGHSYALTHWLRGRPPVPRLSFQRICAVAAKVDRPPVGQATVARDMERLVSKPQSILERPDGSAGPLMSIDEELEVLRSLEASGSQIRFIPARRREILGLLEQGEFDVLHLITHGDFAGLSAADASAVQVEDGAFLAAELSPRMAAALRRAAPLIFFNSCHTGRIGFSLTRLGSWGAQFVHSGCGGFVGTLWPVTDRAALAFARAFYGRMCHGLPIGQAMMAARKQVRERYPNDPTWLAYRCFADPMAHLEPAPASM